MWSNVTLQVFGCTCEVLANYFRSCSFCLCLCVCLLVFDPSRGTSMARQGLRQPANTGGPRGKDCKCISSSHQRHCRHFIFKTSPCVNKRQHSPNQANMEYRNFFFSVMLKDVIFSAMNLILIVVFFTLFPSAKSKHDGVCLPFDCVGVFWNRVQYFHISRRGILDYLCVYISLYKKITQLC